MKPKKILAFETSCDDTSVSVIDTNYKVYSNIISSQIKEHDNYGGVVPEIASRLHIKNIDYVTHKALEESNCSLKEISAIAVSVNPGLIGSLLVGVSYAKGLSYSLGIPLIAINHMLGHIYANKISNPDLEAPFLALIVSGGHTELVNFHKDGTFDLVGRTRDDAAGEAFDKTAKILGLGYPGGPIIDKLAKKGNPKFHSFPRAMRQKTNYDFSFSGLKTSVRNYLINQTEEFKKENLHSIVASVQEAIVDSLVNKTFYYAKHNNITNIVVAGGVSANSRLREKILAKFDQEKIYFPELKYCMDNAAMIGSAAINKFKNKEFADLKLNAFSTKGIRYI